MKRKIFAVLLLLAMLVASTGCKKKQKEQIDIKPTESVEKEPTPTPTQEPTATPTPVVEEESHEGEARSKLTGEWVKEETANKRPYAVVINNIDAADPQSGTSNADIMYEALVEGGITRMLAFYEDLNDENGEPLTRIGSTRSARHYFVSFADEYDAIYVHFGETKYATSKIKKLGIDTLSGLTGIGDIVFYRDKKIKEPHNAFASAEGILKGTEKKKYRTEYEDGYEGHFKFYEEDTDLGGSTKANKVSIHYSSIASPYFIYNEETKQYERYQSKKKHIDNNNQKQLTYKNVIVQFVHQYTIDKKGYQSMDIEDNKGKGYYISNGTAVPITWKKNESTRKMRYYDQAGEELTINQGKTFVSVFPDSRTKDVSFE